MNISEAAKALVDGKTIKIGITEQLCTLFEKEGSPYVKLMGLNAVKYSRDGIEEKEETHLTLDQWKALYGKHEDLVVVEKTADKLANNVDKG